VGQGRGRRVLHGHGPPEGPARGGGGQGRRGPDAAQSPEPLRAQHAVEHPSQGGEFFFSQFSTRSSMVAPTGTGAVTVSINCAPDTTKKGQELPRRGGNCGGPRAGQGPELGKVRGAYPGDPRRAPLQLRERPHRQGITPHTPAHRAPSKSPTCIASRCSKQNFTARI